MRKFVVSGALVHPEVNAMHLEINLKFYFSSMEGISK